MLYFGVTFRIVDSLSYASMVKATIRTDVSTKSLLSAAKRVSPDENFCVGCKAQIRS